MIDGELIDTYGGDFTYRDVTYDINDDESFTFYEVHYGAKPMGKIEIDDPKEIEELIQMLNHG